MHIHNAQAHVLPLTAYSICSGRGNIYGACGTLYTSSAHDLGSSASYISKNEAITSSRWLRYPDCPNSEVEFTFNPFICILIAYSKEK